MAERQETPNRSKFELLRSGVYRISWVATASRREVAVTASILASKLENAVIEDIVVFNRAVQMFRDTVSQYLHTWHHDLSQVVRFTVSDAAGIGTTPRYPVPGLPEVQIIN